MIIDPAVATRLRHGFRSLNRLMVLLWRLGLGKWLNLWPLVLGRYLVIAHIGRRSGLKRRTPVNYAMIDDEVYCVAGFGSVSDWYRNIVANPQIEIWLPDGWWAGVAEEVLHPEARLPIIRQVLKDSGFAGFAAGVNAYAMTDAELDAVTKDYRLIHLRRIAARTGKDGPADLSWVWPLLTTILLPLALLRRKK